MATDSRLVVVFSDAEHPRAYLVRDRLAEAGIASRIENEALQSGPTELLQAVIGPRVVVAEADEVAAREIVAQFRAEGMSDQEATASEDARDELVYGPACPDCGRARMTECPYCQTASSQFPLADRSPGMSEVEQPVLLMCSTCDEPFAPVYHRRCEWCGHDFGEGREIKPKEVAERLNDRVIVAVVATGAVLIAVLGYFATLLK